MPDFAIADAGDPRVAPYRGVSEPALVRSEGRFIAEGRLVVRRLLSSPRVQAESVLLTAAARAALADVLAAHAASLPIYVGSPAVLSEVAGFPIHRGCVAIGRRHEIPAVEDLVPAGEKAVLLLALDGLGDADNVGGLVRCAKAFGADAVVVGPTTVDPFYRKAIRTSMGAVFDVPSCRVDDLGAVLSGCRARGLDVVVLSPDGEPLEWSPLPAGRPVRAVLVAGHEGDGVTAGVRAAATRLVRVAMAPGVDSLNVVSASAIALHHFGRATGRIL